jgi:hypothetical protein
MLMRSTRWSNGKVVSLSHTGDIIEELSGDWFAAKDEVRAAIKAGAKPILMIGDWSSGLREPVDEATFFAEEN